MRWSFAAFREEAELNCYRMLISVNGVGAKAALSILSDHTPERFALAVASGDAKLLTKSAGIGMKTAQRIVLELKDKVAKDQAAAGITGDSPSIVSNVSTGNASEAISALTVLGYARADAARVVSAMNPNWVGRRDDQTGTAAAGQSAVSVMGDG